MFSPISYAKRSHWLPPSFEFLNFNEHAARRSLAAREFEIGIYIYGNDMGGRKVGVSANGVRRR